MKQPLSGYPEALTVKVGLYIAKIYRHALGNSVKEFKRLCFVGLQQLVEFDSGCWVTYDNAQLSKPSDDCWTYQLSERALKENQMVFNKPLEKLQLHTGVTKCGPPTFYPESMTEQRKFYRTEHYKRHCKPFKWSHNLTTVRKSDDSNNRHQMISLCRMKANAFYLQQDIDIKAFIIPHLIEAYRLNRLCSADRDWQRSPSYRAVCDQLGYIKEAEDGFYRLLAPQLVNGHKNQLSLDLTNCLSSMHTKLGEIKIEVTNVDGIYHLEASEDDHLLDKLTKKERSVAALLSDGLRTKEIADKLGSSPRTVEKHLANMYKKLETENKNDTTAYLIRNKVYFD